MNKSWRNSQNLSNLVSFSFSFLIENVKPVFGQSLTCANFSNIYGNTVVNQGKKTWQLRMHCNLRPPEPRQPFPALNTTPYQVWSCWTYPLPCYSVFAADTLHYAVTLTFDLWPWTFAAYRLWRDKTLYQIWTQSSNPRRSYCDFSVWPYDLEHCVTCCARLWDNFHQVWPSTTYPCLNYSASESLTI